MDENQHHNLILKLSIDLNRNKSLDDLDLATRNLQEELYDLGVDSVEILSTSETPIGEKAAKAETVGVLAVAVLPAFLPRLVEYLQLWCMRVENRKVCIKTQVGNRSVEVESSPSALSQEELIQLVTKLTASIQSNPDQNL